MYLSYFLFEYKNTMSLMPPFSTPVGFFALVLSLSLSLSLPPSLSPLTTSSQMKKQGCEIEAKGINYHIKICKGAHPLKIWSRDEDENEKVGNSNEETQTQEKTISASAKYNQPDNVNNNTNLHKSKLHKVRQVLKNVSCHAKPSEILAIMGPSGAGKSTLLEILAGRITPSTRPEILINQKPVNQASFRRVSGYVTQMDILYPLLTVRETLYFSARLKLGARYPPEKISSRVEKLIRELGLGKAADTRVASVSGGERRRVSIGTEVVHSPQVLILDEPTSGLDSASALQIVTLLQTMAVKHGRTVILSIHQPGARVVSLFGSILLLANGTVVHQGTVDQLETRLTTASLTVPAHFNVVEFAIDAIEALSCHHPKKEIQGEGEFAEEPHLHIPKRDRCTLQQLFQLHKVADEDSLSAVAATTSTSTQIHDYANSWFQEVSILTHRFVKNVCRTRPLFTCRIISMIVSSLVLGSIFYNLEETKVMERVGLFAFILTFLLSSTIEALPIFLQEREILMKETLSGSYRVSSYVTANSLVFLPFLAVLALLFSVPVYWLAGLYRDFYAFVYFLLLIWLILYTANSVVICISAISPNFIVGNSIISGVMGCFFLFSGYFIMKKAMPGCWVFMHYLSLFKYPFEGFLVNEFSGKNRCVMYEMGICVLRGEEVLRREGMGEKGSRWKNVGVMVGFILGYRLLAYVILRCRFRCAQKGGLRKALSST
jgi:ATP-binding cassette, subfamily G (WHITE), member 2